MAEREVYDAAVLGAGPAGLAAAVALADAGVRVTLVDAGAQLGGQYYRQPSLAFAEREPGRLHHHWRDFTRLADRCAQLQHAGLIRYLSRTEVWAVEPVGTADEARWLVHPTAAVTSPFEARTLLLATGAYERQIPFPGWDLPGVMTAGGAQALLKESLVVPDGRVVVAGTGPLLLPVAAGLAAAGADVVGLYEANRFRGYLRTARGVRLLATHPSKLVEAAGYGATLAKCQVPIRSGRMVIAAHGSDRLEAVQIARVSEDGAVVSGTEQTIACDTLAIGYGLVPQVELGLELGCPHRVPAGATAVLDVDGEQRTGVAGVWAAGEVTGVAGAAAALVAGEIAGRSMARYLVGDSPPVSRSLMRERDRASAFADLLLACHPVPRGWVDRLEPDTLVCRCEQVPAWLVAESLEGVGACDVRTVKLLTRVGMGWCQGRMCGPALVGLAERSRLSAAGKPAGADAEVDIEAQAEMARDQFAVARRPVARPVTLGVLTERYKEYDNNGKR